MSGGSPHSHMQFLCVVNVNTGEKIFSSVFSSLIFVTESGEPDTFCVLQNLRTWLWGPPSLQFRAYPGKRPEPEVDQSPTPFPCYPYTRSWNGQGQLRMDRSDVPKRVKTQHCCWPQTESSEHCSRGVGAARGVFRP